MPFACIYVPNFPVAAALRAEPELQTHAIAIFEGKPPLEQIIAVNETARELGISPGMSKAQAELCSELCLCAPSLPFAGILRSLRPARLRPVFLSHAWKTPPATRFCSISPAWNLSSAR